MAVPKNPEREIIIIPHCGLVVELKRERTLVDNHTPSRATPFRIWAALRASLAAGPRAKTVGQAVLLNSIFYPISGI